MPATIEKIFAAGSSYDITSLTWSPEIETISDLGASQINVYWGANAATLGTSTVYKILDNWRDTYVASTKTISLAAATYTNDSGASVPVVINIAADSIKIKRETSLSPLRTFRDGAKLSASDLSIIHNQLFDSLEEEDANTAAEFTAERTYLTTNFYTKTEIDTQMQALSLFPGWASGTAYLVGDVVLHNGQIWYATINHTASTEPSSTNSQWTVVAPDATLENITYIRKFPGLKGTPVAWNTIVPRSATALGLAVKHPKPADISGDYSGTIFTVNDENDLKLFHVGATKTFEFDARANFNASPYFANDVYMFQGISNKSLFLGTAPAGSNLVFTGGSSVGSHPRLVITRSDSSNAYLECRKDDGTSHFQVEQTGLLTMNNGFQSRGSDNRIYKNLWLGDEVALASLPSLSTTGINGITLGGSDNHVFGNGNIRLGAWTGSAYTEKITVEGDTGNVGTVGQITASGKITSSASVETDTVKLTAAGMASSSYLGTDANGSIISVSGPSSTNNVIYNVTGRTASPAIAALDPVYLERVGEGATTATWMKAGAGSTAYKASVGVAYNITTHTDAKATGRIDFISGTAADYNLNNYDNSSTGAITIGTATDKYVKFTFNNGGGGIKGSGAGTAGDPRIYEVNFGGISGEPCLTTRFYIQVQAAIDAGHLNLNDLSASDYDCSSGLEYVAMTNSANGPAGNITITRTNLTNSEVTLTGFSGGDLASLGQDFDVMFMGTLSGFTGKVCNCPDSTDEDECWDDGAGGGYSCGGTYNQNLLPGDFYYVDGSGGYRNFKYGTSGSGTMANNFINDPIGLALTTDIMMIMPYRANKL